MQSSKIEFLSKYNSLLKSSLKESPEFPNELCQFLAEEYEFQSVILFRVNENNNLIVLGKVGDAKKSFTEGSVVDCGKCDVLKSNIGTINLNSDKDCAFKSTDFVLSESCSIIKLSNSQRILLRVAKKTPFNKNDEDNLRSIGEALYNLLNIWVGNRKSFAMSTSEIVTSIAHELRTPSNSIMGFASLLNEDNLTTSQSEYVATLKDSAFNLLSLINDIIDISKIETGQSKEVTSSIAIKDFINDIVKIFTDKIENKRIEFLINIDKDIPATIKLDAPKLRYVLLNLITNSLRITEKGKISISISSAGKDKLNFKISDTSTGISTNKAKNIFKPFAMTELGDNKIGNSTGLGLILAKKYIELLSGEIDVVSSIGKGITYNFTIQVEQLSTIEQQISNLPKNGNKNKILVVEDDYATSKLLSNYLNKWGYEPTIVNSADQALKAIQHESFLAILMDIVLPDANGFDLLQRFREHKNSKNTPVIVCSVEAEQQKAFLMGAVEYFVKPIRYKYLVEVLTSYKLKKDSNILIVDDDVPTLNLIKEAVLQAGYNAIAESHSSKVMGMIQTMSLDLAIIDLDMPEINGFDLIKQIKSTPSFSKLPVIIYTGKENYQEDLKKIDGLFSDLLDKNSTNIEELSETINQMINSYDNPPPKEEVIKQKDVVKILLVEDYKHSQIIVTRLLKKNDFESIVVVENGAEALDEVQKQKFDLILMDMQMPVMNGFEATEKIRQLSEYRETPIIALTAFAMKGDREKCLEAGATDYIPKPIDSQEFIEKVKYYTESKVDATT